MFSGANLDWLRYLWPFILLDLGLKGFALYRSARSGQTRWFVALFLVNSLGILPGIYLYLNKTKHPSQSNNHVGI